MRFGRSNDFLQAWVALGARGDVAVSDKMRCQVMLLDGTDFSVRETILHVDKIPKQYVRISVRRVVALPGNITNIPQRSDRLGFVTFSPSGLLLAVSEVRQKFIVLFALRDGNRWERVIDLDSECYMLRDQVRA